MTRKVNRREPQAIEVLRANFMTLTVCDAAWRAQNRLPSFLFVSFVSFVVRPAAWIRLAGGGQNVYTTGVQIQELNHVAIHVQDVEASCQFYKDVLRLEPIPRPAFTFPGAWFRVGQAQELHIIGDRTKPVHSHNRGNHYALRVDDLNHWEEHLKKVKADFRPRKMRPDGAWQVFVRDPDGHMIELFTGP